MYIVTSFRESSSALLLGVLLALPFAPVHEDMNECHGLYENYQPPAEAQRENPFAVLAKLKQK